MNLAFVNFVYLILALCGSISSKIFVNSLPKSNSETFEATIGSSAQWPLTFDGFQASFDLETGIEVEVDLSDVHFYLHTKENQEEADELFVGDSEALTNSHFHANGPLWVLVHGFGANIGGSFPYGTGIDLINTNSFGNVILLDWSKLAGGLNYVRAVKNSYAVSNYTAEFLQFLITEKVVRSDDIHLIGFSLGGQIVGITGKRFEWLTQEIVGRVTGLDPAWPLFATAHVDDRISPDDARFVDVIHTNGGTLGTIQPRGHVDFYPNGGSKQPGCGLDLSGSCSHARAAYFFKESIANLTPFKSCNCLDWDEFDSGNCECNSHANMGYNVNQTAAGKFYLRTNKESPYAQG